MSRLLAALRPLLVNARIAWYEWAQREMHPMHPDAGQVVLRLRELRDERGRS